MSALRSSAIVFLELQRRPPAAPRPRHLHVEPAARPRTQREAGQRRLRPARAARARGRNLLQLQLGALDRGALAPPARTRTRAPTARPGAGARPPPRPASPAARRRAASRSRRSLGDRSSCIASADPRQRVADELVHHPPAAERRLDEHHPGRLGPRPRRSRPPARSPAPRAAPRAPRPRPRARRTRRACPRWRRTSGRSRASRRRRRRRARPARRASRTSIATPRRARQLVEHGRDAAAGRVAHAAQSSPAASSSASTAGHSERVSDSMSASRSNSPRASMIAVPCSPTEPETRTRSPGRSAPGDSRARGSTTPDAGGADVHGVGVAALDDLGVAGHDLDAGGVGRRGDRLDLGAQRRPRAAPPRARATRLSASGRAPGDREVVDRAVDGQLADRPAREAHRLDDEAVGRHRELGRRRPTRAGVAQRVERSAERRHEQALDQRLGRLAARAVRHRDRARRGTSRAWRGRSR